MSFSAFGAVLPIAAFAVTESNVFVTVSSSTAGVEGIFPVGGDFYVTTRGVTNPPFRADIGISANSPYYLVKPSSGRMNLTIGEYGEYRVRDESGAEDSFTGCVYVVKIEIEPRETNVCWKTTSCKLKLTDDSVPGGVAVWTSNPAGISGSGNSITFNPSALSAGEYTVTVKSSIVPSYTDTCIVRVVASTLIIYVDQPGSGGDRDTYEIGVSFDGKKKVQGGIDVGHAFWSYRCSYSGAIQNVQLRDYVNTTMGYYPSLPVDLDNPNSPGEVMIPDDGHMDSHEVDHEWKISLLQLLNGLQYAQQLYNNPGTYNLNTNNCTDMALGAATAVGVTIQATQGTWPKGGGFNPGDLGEDLRALQ